MNSSIIVSSVVCLLCAPVMAQDLDALLSKQLGECRSGENYHSCTLYAGTLEHQAVAGGDTRLADEAKCLRLRARTLSQLKTKCSEGPDSSPECSEFSHHLETDQTVDECQKLANGAGIDIGVLTSSAPGCKGQLTVDAHNDGWQSAVLLEPGQKGLFYVPVGNGGPQEWLIIDPANRGANTIIGNGVRAGDGFAAPGLPEGALLVKGGDGQIKTFDKPVGSVEISVPGNVTFLANDTQGVNDHHPIHIGFHGNGFDDNSGTITVNWVKLPCPVSTRPEPVHVAPQVHGDVRIVPSGSCYLVGNEMVLVNSTDHLITATIRRDVNAQSQNITVPLAAHQSFPLGCTLVQIPRNGVGTYYLCNESRG